MCCSAEVLCKDQVIRMGKKKKKKKLSSVSLFKWELLFQRLIQSSDVQKGALHILQQEEKKKKKHCLKKRKKKKKTGFKERKRYHSCIIHNTVQNDWDLCPMKLQCCALYKRIHECIMRGRNEPRKARWANPPGERKLFRVDEDTIHNNIGKGETFFSPPSFIWNPRFKCKNDPTCVLSGWL